MTSEAASWSTLGTATVSDALDRLRFPCQCSGIVPIAPGLRTTGPAFTVLMHPADNTGTVGDYIDEVPAGDVVVLANAGRLSETVWGDLLTSASRLRGVAGTVIDGVCRDRDRALRRGYAIFSRGSFMRSGKGRVRMEATQVPVTISGVVVRPGDRIVGDDDGVVVVPRDLERDVLSIALEIHGAEEAIRRALDRGERLEDARRRVDYHRLQEPAARR